MPDKEKTENTKSTRAVAEGDRISDRATLQSLGFGTMTSFGTAWVEALSDMGSEVLSFVADRIKEDVKTQHQILNCDEPAKLHHIQAEFVQKAIEQYTAETGKLVEMGQKLFPNMGGTKKN